VKVNASRFVTAVSEEFAASIFKVVVYLADAAFPTEPYS
jgi:hypothetical protein